MGWWVCLWGIFLISNWCRRVQSTVGSILHGKGGLGCIWKVAKLHFSVVSVSVPVLWSLPWIPVLPPLSDITHKPNTPFPLQFTLVMVFSSHRQRANQESCFHFNTTLTNILFLQCWWIEYNWYSSLVLLSYFLITILIITDPYFYSLHKQWMFFLNFTFKVIWNSFIFRISTVKIMKNIVSFWEDRRCSYLSTLNQECSHWYHLTQSIGLVAFQQLP